jgi:Flp pilus assembly protein TadD
MRGYFANNAIALSLFFSQQYAEAERWARRTLEQWPSHPVAKRIRAAALVRLGRAAEAGFVIDELLAQEPNASVAITRQAPYQNKDALRDYVDALRIAGLPE